MIMTEPITDQRNFKIDREEIMSTGHLACPGCGAAIIMRHALKVLGRNTIMTIPACCWAVIDGPFPYSTVGIPLLHVAFETAAISASGIRAGLDAQGKRDITVVAWAGDGATFDIGFGAVSAAAERNDNFIYVCYDNEAYMNTGIQRSSATPRGAWTTTTPTNYPKEEPKKNLIGIMAEHRIPYAATSTIAYPDDLRRKFEKAMSIEGFRLLHIFSPCPPGHKSTEANSVRISRLAVQTRVFPLYEVENGKTYRLTENPKPLPLDEYLKLQGRFKHLSVEERMRMQKSVDDEWEILLRKAGNHDC